MSRDSCRASFRRSVPVAVHARTPFLAIALRSEHLTNGGAGRLPGVSQTRFQVGRPTTAGLPEQEPECGKGTQEARWIGRPLNTDRELMVRVARGGEAAFTLRGRN